MDVSSIWRMRRYGIEFGTGRARFDAGRSRTYISGMIKPFFLVRSISRGLVKALIVGSAISGATLPVRAEECAREKLDQVIDGAGASLRKLKQDVTPRVQAKIRELRAIKGWSDGEAEERAYAAAQDARLQDLDTAASLLLQKIDQIGAADGNAARVECGRIAEATAAGVELQATVRARSQYLISRLDALIAESRPTDGKGSASGAAPPQAAASAGAAPKTSPPPTAQAEPAPPPQRGWAAAVTTTPSPSGEVRPAGSSQAQSVEPVPPPAGDPMPSYSIEEIAAAATGVFGKASANLAGVLEQAFGRYGRPTGYIIGTEAGGAFIAGVRYGKGTLVLRTGESLPIFWHGPSIGAEFGASGSEVLFLVYKLANANDIFGTFQGVEGSAYAVGGLGATFLSNGRVQMAPIRAGVGLRLGANIGYTRFTRRQTWNPF